MENYFTDDIVDDSSANLYDDSSALTDSFGLPTARKISRDSFATPEFDVDSFLTSHHHYQTLEDIQEQLSHWSEVLEKELVDLINLDYSKFVGLGESLNQGRPKVKDMEVETLAFQNEVKKIQSKLKNDESEIKDLFTKKKQILGLENLVESLILYHEKLSDVESRTKDPDTHSPRAHSTLRPTGSLLSVPESTLSIPQSKSTTTHYTYTVSELEELGTSLLSCEQLLSRLPHQHPFVKAQRPRIVALRLHANSVFPTFFKEYKQLQKEKKELGTEREAGESELEGKQVFALLLLYKQIQNKIFADEEKSQSTN